MHEKLNEIRNVEKNATIKYGALHLLKEFADKG